MSCIATPARMNANRRVRVITDQAHGCKACGDVVRQFRTRKVLFSLVLLRCSFGVHVARVFGVCNDFM